MTDESQVSPYGSAHDLPSVQALEEQVTAFSALGGLLTADQRKELAALKQRLRQLASLVDSFYRLLGPRNWVFTGDLNVSAMEGVVDTTDADTAENRLIAYYEDPERITFQLQRLNRFAAMRVRMKLLTKAHRDFQERRYYSTVLVLLTVMDGFVNDIDTATRRGLHARTPEDMVAWDSVAGHHLGLGHAHESFLKSIYKTDTTEVTELHRHGLLHGTLVNFDNEIVASKAWNRLFAVADWAEARERHNVEPEPVPSLEESIDRWNEIQARTSRIDQWQPYEYELDPTADEAPETRGYLQEIPRCLAERALGTRRSALHRIRNEEAQHRPTRGLGKGPLLRKVVI